MCSKGLIAGEACSHLLFSAVLLQHALLRLFGLLQLDLVCLVQCLLLLCQFELMFLPLLLPGLGQLSAPVQGQLCFKSVLVLSFQVTLKC